MINNVFRPSRSSGTTTVSMRLLIRENAFRLTIGLALAFVNRGTAFVLPLASKFVVDDIVIQNNWKRVPWIAAVIGVSALIETATAFLNGRVLGMAAQNVIARLRVSVAGHVLRLPLTYFESTNSGAIASRIISDPEGARFVLGSGLVLILRSLLTALIALAILLYLNWQLTLATLSVVVGLGGAVSFGMARMRELFRSRGQVRAELTGRLVETIAGIQIVKAYTAEEREEAAFAKGTFKALKIANTLTSRLATMGALSGLISTASAGALMVWGSLAIRDGQMTLGDFFLYSALIALLASPLAQVGDLWSQITEARASLDRLNSILETPLEEVERDSTLDSVHLKGAVVFNSVSFSYAPGQAALQDVSFHLPVGTTTALVGSSGAGKTTVAKLLMRFITPTAGGITIDGVDLEKLNVRSYRSRLGVVLQESFLFDDTVANNIAYGKPQATRAEVVVAARIAHCHDFIQALPREYETPIGERAVRLSGGQRQRIAIARAILADPAILILDEATSNLDSSSERLIQDGLAQLRYGRTTVVIAHRLSTIRSADQILVLEAGRIVERGHHRELLERNGRYRQLYDEQYAIQGDRFINPGEEAPTTRAKPRVATDSKHDKHSHFEWTGGILQPLE